MRRSGVRLRIISPDDMEKIERWYGMTDYFGYATGFKSFSEIKRLLSEPSRTNRLFLMVETEDRDTVGFLLGEFKGVKAGQVLWINILIIDPAHQRMGYGTCAIDKLLRFAKKQYGRFTCVVAVSDQNIQGLSFWQKIGFAHSSDIEESLNENRSSHVSILRKEISTGD